MIEPQTNKSITAKDALILKIARKPARFYQLIQYSKSKLNNYASLMSHFAFVTKANQFSNFVLYIKINSIEHTILNKDQWNTFISNETIKLWLVNQLMMKIEYDIIQSNQTNAESQKQLIEEMPIENFVSSIISVLNQDKSLSEHLLKSLFQLKETRHAQLNKNGSLNCIDPQSILINKFNQMKSQIETLNQIEDSLLSTNYDEENNKCNTCINDNLITFQSYYNTESKNSFHSKLIRETLPSNFEYNQMQ